MTNVEKGNYKWFVLLNGFLSQAFTYGITYSVGVLYKDWINYFDSSASFLSLVGSAPTSVSCLMGPISGFFLTKFGSRSTAFAGGFLMSLGLSASYLAETPEVLLLTYGIITGLGLGFHFYISCTMANDYFFENRMLAEGVIGSGIGLGNFIFSISQQQLSNKYTWKGAMLITGGITFHLCLISMFCISSKTIETHPLNFWKTSDKKNRFQESTDCCTDKTIPMTLAVTDHSTHEIEVKNTKSKNSFFRRSLALWKNPLFLMIIISDLMTWLAIFIPYVHLVERGKLLENVDENTAAWLSSTLGLASVIGRPCTGALANYFQIDPLRAYVANQMVCGIFMFLSSFWSTLEGLFVFGAVFGFLSNGYGFIKASAAKLLGPEKFAVAFSWMLLFEGIGIMAGPIIAGYIYDTTQSYLWSFRLGGFLLVLSASICFFKPLIKNLEKKGKSFKKSSKLSAIRTVHVGKEDVVFQT